jgi:hypothetical protein
MGVVWFNHAGGELDAEDGQDLVAGQVEGCLGFDNRLTGGQQLVKGGGSHGSSSGR